ncbi:MAG: aminotransferase class V-fold PLP-dependent enzyme [Leptotrichiaceae bacterium]|nr:aminotransferase class V-fold PLP-dependent enzyme [Leptotrichiaceae bacterium]MBP6280855.1 aminotransferase class V-fold PLP-dependent enzyme [Leptotrichiaceae bacterium]MBP7100673.1 aminotransferase class V-fold PLP-dependent enzyme [Leptotrichiaceae bacterium]MBP7739317.1 aminotransferase class V-fold PLP-dependent enzyme [Leptotrichiaceae bacterium]MBP9629305.1 aminotransferase class V-fold PLP-dependent enzyme [Leptotrichiaceae bacterium]
MIYFDNASTTYYKPKEVIESTIFAMKNTGNNGRGINEISINTSRDIFNVREKFIKLFNGYDSRNIVFTSNATESLNTVISGLFSSEDHVITTEAEHNSVLRPLYKLRETGLGITFLKIDEVIKFNKNDMKKYLEKNTKAIICTHASNLTGDLLDIKNIGEFCEENNLIFILDASQSLGIIPIDVEKYKIDILCFTGHKGLMGPQGTGGIYIKEGIDVKPLKVGGSGVDTYNERHPITMPEKLEAGTLNGHGIIGLGAAIDFINEKGIKKIYIKENNLMWKFYEGIKDIKGIKIYGHFMEKNIKVDRIPILTLNINDIDSGDICSILDEEYNIVTRAGGHCAPLMHKALGTEKQGSVRFSFSYFNTEKEVEKAIFALKKIAQEVDI